MKLLLLQPPIQDFYETAIRLQPIGLCYLKAAIQKFLPEMQVSVRDYHSGHGRRTLPLPPELSYLKDFYGIHDKSPFSTFHHYYHFGAPFDALADEVAREKPDLVGISSLFSPYHREALRCAEEIKKRLNVPVVLGGSHVSAVPERVLEHPAVDYVIAGEGERPLVELLKALETGAPLESVPNLGFKRTGKRILNARAENYALEELPAPDLSDLPSDGYRFEGRPLSFIITSRSCPHRCSFCSVHATFGFKFRRRTPENVLEELKLRYAQGYRVFDFEDDNLTYYLEDMKRLCRMISLAFPAKDMELLAMNGISYLSLDAELLGLMKQAGFTHLNLALVTSDTTVRETTKRPHTVEKYLEVVEAGHRLGFKIVSYQILGLPDETLESMVQTLAFNAKLPVLLGASMFYMTPNAPIARPFGTPSEPDIFKSRLTAMAVETPRFARKDLYTLFISTRIINFLKGLAVGREKAALTEALALAESKAGRSALGAQILRRLLEEKVMFAATPDGFKPLPKFDAGLFFQVWAELGSVTTLAGNRIDL